MVLYAGPSYLPYVYAHIKTTRAKYMLQYLDTAANYIKVLMALFISHLLQASYMPIRDYHKVTRIVGINIHNEKVPFSPKENVIPLIIIML